MEVVTSGTQGVNNCFRGAPLKFMGAFWHVIGMSIMSAIKVRPLKSHSGLLRVPEGQMIGYRVKTPAFTVENTRVCNSCCLKAKPNRSGCGHRERSQLFEGFSGKRYCWDCIWLRGCFLARSKPASTLEPDRNQARVCGVVPLQPCRCHRTADCNGKEYLQWPPLCRSPPLPIWRRNRIFERKSASDRPQSHGEKLHLGACELSSVDREKECSRWQCYGQTYAA